MEHDQEMNDPGRDPVHELLCKIVFGEATDEEREEAEALLAESEERRAQLAEIEATVALVRGAREAEMPDVLGDDRFDAVVAAGAAVDDAPPVGGAARFRGARLLAAAAALAVCGAGAAWWSSSQAANDGEFLAYDIGDARVARLDPVEASDEPAAGVDMGEELKVVTQPPQSSAAGRLVDAGPIFGDGTDTALEVDPFKQHRDQLMSAEKEKPEGAFIGYSTVTTPDVQVPYLSEVPFDVVKLQREFSNAATESSDPTALESAGVSAYKGPGDSVPPSTVVGGELQLLERKRASGPSSPGPASRLSPEIAARLESLGYSGATPGADTEGPGADTEGPRWLSGNGYADSTTESAASDAFFLGRGLARPVDELRTFHRVPRCEPTRRPNERPRDMFFRFWGDNPYVVTKQDAQSTFAADVDTASFSLARRMLREGYLPPREQVRTEEFVNFARPDLAPPAEGTFAIHGELAPSPFGGREDRWLLRVGVRAAEIERSERPPLALTFVVDTSGSMREDNRLELVKHAMRLLVGQLDARDSIAIVRFANDASEVLAPTPATARDAIETALFALQPTGSTNAEGGLKLGYSLAEQTLLEGVQSRVVFLSDGVANVGETDQARIAADVAHSAQRGIFLNTIGVGMANHNDAFLEQLADEGQGVCDYVGDAEDARRAIVERFVGGFVTLAKDVKIQVEFDPGQVLRWRQLGYENRAVRDADFRNDAIDAGEIGPGHQVTCLYELELPTGANTADAPLATVRLRWIPVKTGEQQPATEAVEIERRLVQGSIATSPFRAATLGFRRAALSAQLAECLRRSFHARGNSMTALGKELAQLLSEDRAEDTATIAAMTKQAIELGLERFLPPLTAGDPDAKHRDAYYDALIESLGGADEKAVGSGYGEEYERRVRELLEGDRGTRGH